MMRWLCTSLAVAAASVVPSFMHGNETTLHSFKCTTACCEQFAACQGPSVSPAFLAQCLAAMPADCYVAVNATYIFRHTNELCIGRDTLGVDLSFLQKGPARMISDLIIWHVSWAANYHYPETHYTGWLQTDLVRRRLEEESEDGFGRRETDRQSDRDLWRKRPSRAITHTARTYAEDHPEPWDPAGYLPLNESDFMYDLFSDCKIPKFDDNGVPAMDYYKAQGIPFTYHNGPMRDPFSHPDFNYDTPWLVMNCNEKGQWPFAEEYHLVWSRALLWHTNVFNAGCVAIPARGTPRPILVRSFKAEWPYGDDRASYSHSPVSTLIAAQYDPIDTENPVFFIKFDNEPELQLHLLWWSTTQPFINATIESSFFGSNTVS